MKNSFKSRSVLKFGNQEVEIFSLKVLEGQGLAKLDELPYSLKILLENLLRHEDGDAVTGDDIKGLASWSPQSPPKKEIAFTPSRVLLQDFTGVPAVVDLAAMRDAIIEMGGHPRKVNPLQPVELVIDHSVQVDAYGTPDSFRINADLEFKRNQERYALLRWGQKSLDNFRVVPPDTGIVHQVNLEYLARVVVLESPSGTPTDLSPSGDAVSDLSPSGDAVSDLSPSGDAVSDLSSPTGIPMAFPDTVIGTDSHTTMINGLGVLGWGVGGIEAEAVMLGQPITMLIPEIVGFHLTGELQEGVTSTDLVLTITEMLRKKGVVGKFVEFYGTGLAKLTVADRATVSNMCPEYGATAAIFPITEQTLEYLRLTGRDENRIQLVKEYAQEQGLLYSGRVVSQPRYSDYIELDLSRVEPCIAGPRRPQDRIPLKQSKTAFLKALEEFRKSLPSRGVGEKSTAQAVMVKDKVQDGSVVIAAITSCTNTSNPDVMIAAGLLAKKAVERGLKTKPWVKTSLAPGSQVVTEYLKKAGLLPYLEQLGFYLVGFGCTTCIGNSGPLPEPVREEISRSNLMAVSVLSGNRNFEGRINPMVRANYLASPPLVVAYALSGRIDFDLYEEPLGHDKKGNPVFLREIWPSLQEMMEAIRKAIDPELFKAKYADVFQGDERWNCLPVPEGDLFGWDPQSLYIKSPPFFKGMQKEPEPVKDVVNARVLAFLGDSITTDHISPAGSILSDSPAGKYLIEHGVDQKDFNSYGARRGNHEVMVRGTFANNRLKNHLVPGVEGGHTLHFPDCEKLAIFDAAMKYEKEGVPLIVLAGKEYGSGSSRDWAAKGPRLLGIVAVLAESFERIHRSNLIGMGILPLEFEMGESASTHQLTGSETYSISGMKEGLSPGASLEVHAKDETGKEKSFSAKVRIDTPQELAYYKHGGILQYVLRQLLENSCC